jgi:hypothetical protein
MVPSCRDSAGHAWQDDPRLDQFRDRRTPESRTPYVLLLLAVIGAVVVVWRLLVTSQVGAEILLGVVVAAVVFAIWRFARQRG